MTRTSRNSFVWLFTIYAVASYILMCAYINPPFTVTGEFSESQVTPGLADVLVIFLAVWFFGGGIVVLLMKGRSEKLRRAISFSVVIGVPIGVLIVAAIYFRNALGNENPGLTKYYLGQGVGMVGIGWLFILCFLWWLFSLRPSRTESTVGS